MLKVDKLNVSYWDLQVIWDVSLEVNPGEIVALIGSNGAGKSTILNTIAGSTIPISGEILFKGNQIQGQPAHAVVNQGISLVPEQQGIFTTMTVLDNLELGAFSSKARPKKEESLQNVFSIFPRLKERQTQIAGTLSGGERQMLAIGRAMMTQPELLMLDEPSLGLAPLIVTNIFDVIKDINSQGIPILLVEQNVHLALKIADRAYILENGKIIDTDNASKLLRSDHVREAYLGL